MQTPSRALFASLLLAVLFVMAAPMPASAAVSRLLLSFPDGATQTVASGRIAGRASNDYVVRASAGQVLSVRLDADSTMAYFNVLPPGSEEAIFIGSVSGNEFRGGLATAGDYVIRVHLMAAGARRGESADYSLSVGLSDPPPAPFDQSLSLQGITVRITSPDLSACNTLRIETTGLTLDSTPFERSLPGQVSGAFDRFVGPEQLAAVESVFARRIAVGTEGRARQILYSLIPGEAGRQLRLERTEEF